MQAIFVWQPILKVVGKRGSHDKENVVQSLLQPNNRDWINTPLPVANLMP